MKKAWNRAREQEVSRQPPPRAGRWGLRREETMSAFGPFYPPLLQDVVNHAERLSELLLAHELAPPADEWAQAWVLGRAEEVARLTEHLIDSWRTRRLDEVQAAAALRDYVAAVHEGMAAHLGCTAPVCCGGSQATTRPTAPSDRSRTIFDGEPFEPWTDDRQRGAER
jgi:hypothetical protein